MAARNSSNVNRLAIAVASVSCPIGTHKHKVFCRRGGFGDEETRDELIF